MLAFKSDVSHWRKKDELTGVSVRYVSFDMIFSRPLIPSMQNGVFSCSLKHAVHMYQSFFTVQIITNVFVQLVILLYLIDNNTDTSWMILMGSGMGVLIEAWKVWLACT